MKFPAVFLSLHVIQIKGICIHLKDPFMACIYKNIYILNFAITFRQACSQSFLHEGAKALFTH